MGLNIHILLQPNRDPSLYCTGVTSIVQINQYVYHQISNISHNLVGNKIIDQSDVVWALPVDAVSSQLHLHSRLNTWLQWIGQRQLQDQIRNI